MFYYRLLRFHVLIRRLFFISESSLSVVSELTYCLRYGSLAVTRARRPGVVLLVALNKFVLYRIVLKAIRFIYILDITRVSWYCPRSPFVQRTENLLVHRRLSGWLGSDYNTWLFVSVKCRPRNPPQSLAMPVKPWSVQSLVSFSKMMLNWYRPTWSMG